MVHQIMQAKPAVRVALVGKYIELEDAYMSVREVAAARSLVLEPRRDHRLD